VFKTLLLFFVFFTPLFSLFGEELAVLPYKVEASSGSVQKDLSEDYAKVLGLGISVKYSKSFYNPYELKKDLQSSGINPSRNITLDELHFLGTRRRLSYIVVGTVYKLSGSYRAKSVLYSVKGNRVIARSNVEAGDLLTLATKDLEELFVYDVGAHENLKTTVDLLLLVDSSYKNSEELSLLKKQLKDSFSTIYEYWPGSRISLLQFDNKREFSVRGFSTFSAFSKGVDSLNTGGAAESDTLYRALRFGYVNNRWRRNSKRSVFVLSNTSISSSGPFSTLLNEMKGRGITLSFYLGGRVSQKSWTYYESMADRTGGRVLYPVYHKRFVNHQNKSEELFMYKERLYVSSHENSTWREQFNPGDMRQLFDLPEGITPYDLSDYYHDGLKGVVIKEEALENNGIYLINEYVKGTLSGDKVLRAKPLARVMLSTIDSSIWVDVVNYEDLKHFKAAKEAGRSFYLGVRIDVNSRSVFGYSFNPYSYEFGFTGDYMVSAIAPDLKEVTSSPYKYFNKGLLSPPLWFINVKVDRLEEYESENDLRSG
jgi:hypothetical protein